MKNDIFSAPFLSPEAISRLPPFPSAQTLYRFHLVALQFEAMIAQATAQVSPEVWERDRGDIQRIEQAATVEDVLDLTSIASGLAEPPWHRRMRQFGDEAVPLITQRLRGARKIEDDHVRSLTYEHLLSALRWKGEAGASALLDCFDELGIYGQSLACVSLGLLDARDAAPTIWAFYASVKRDRSEDYLVGALWGLIDLQEPRAADALAELLFEGHYFYELFGFLSLAGDIQAVLPLLLLSTLGARISKDVAQHAAMSLVSIGHRVGRESLLAEFEKVGSGLTGQQKHREGAVDDILATPPQTAEEYFALFYRGLQPEDIDLDELRAMDRRLEQELEDGPHPRLRPSSLPDEKPGRNDPCWCGSGKKYKHCHLREDQRRHRPD